jgi:phosphatidylserine/phosphatidylglycerophosphate/cardiolipin synthase-like enzyme
VPGNWQALFGKGPTEQDPDGHLAGGLLHANGGEWGNMTPDHMGRLCALFLPTAPIAKALLDAHKRGVQVQVILDKSQRTEKYSSADFLANQGVPTLIDANHAIAHNKVIVIDGEIVLTGSFNFTKAAQEKNAENVRRMVVYLSRADNSLT